MNLDALFQDLLSSGIKLLDPETLRKFRVLNAFQLVFVVLAPFLGLVYFYVGAVQIFFAIVAAGVFRLVAPLCWSQRCHVIACPSRPRGMLALDRVLTRSNLGALPLGGREEAHSVSLSDRLVVQLFVPTHD